VRLALVFGAEAIGEAGPVMLRLAMLARDRAGRGGAGLAGSVVLAFGELVPACGAAVPGPCPRGHCGRPGAGLMRRPEARDRLA